ncbi:hypothetical protein U9M48_004657 [Paspalum notatum var. saurae]|uniref:Uncharacterized protein n=1 Tax=Paspalum notatum var. saurae TaxID=547442 RepID=A0AAQ3PP50_PASNO
MRPEVGGGRRQEQASQGTGVECLPAASMAFSCSGAGIELATGTAWEGLFEIFATTVGCPSKGLDRLLAPLHRSFVCTQVVAVSMAMENSENGLSLVFVSNVSLSNGNELFQGLGILLWLYLYSSMRRYAINYIGADTWFSTFVAIVVAVPMTELFCIMGQIMNIPPPK